jgi:hypothetical protein
MIKLEKDFQHLKILFVGDDRTIFDVRIIHTLMSYEDSREQIH